MSKFHQDLKKQELSFSERVDKETCLEAKNGMSPEEFKATYYKSKNSSGEYSYYKRNYQDVEDSEINTYLLYEVLKTQRMLHETQMKMKRHTATIMGIMIAVVSLAVFGFLVGLGSLV